MLHLAAEKCHLWPSTGRYRYKPHLHLTVLTCIEDWRESQHNLSTYLSHGSCAAPKYLSIVCSSANPDIRIWGGLQEGSLERNLANASCSVCTTRMLSSAFKCPVLAVLSLWVGKPQYLIVLKQKQQHSWVFEKLILETNVLFTSWLAGIWFIYLFLHT